MQLLLLLIDNDFSRSCDAAFSKPPGNDRSMARHSAPLRQNACGDLHPSNIFWGGLSPHEDYRVLVLRSGHFDCILGREGDLTYGCARRCRQAFREYFDLHSLFLQLGNEKIIELVGFNPENGFVCSDEAFINHVERDAHCGAAGAFAVARLQKVKLPLLDGKFEVLHVAVVLFEQASGRTKLLIDPGHQLLQFRKRTRRSNSSNYLFALRICQKLSVEFFLASCRITSKADTCGAGLAEVAEDHLLNIDGGTEIIGDIRDSTVLSRTFVIPGTEHCIACLFKLYVGILREFFVRVRINQKLVALYYALHGFECFVAIGMRRRDLFHLDVGKLLARNIEHGCAEHLNKAVVAVVGENRIVCQLSERVDGFVVKAKVQDCVHHSRHRKLRARTHAHE